MLHERVTGPFNGYYVAVYACEMGEFGERYLGFYKICGSKPENYWESLCLLNGCCEQKLETGEAALDDAESIARNHIGNLSPR